MKVSFLYNFLFINNCKEVLFPLGIRGLIQLDDLVVVFVYGATMEEMENLPTRNIYAFNEEGKQVWQVQEPLQYDDGVVSYSDIRLKKNGEIIAGSTKGDEYIVNINDGSVEHIKGRRPW